MVANGLNKVNPGKIWIFIFTIIVSILFPFSGNANSYKWEDITEPFSPEFELFEGQNVIIEIRIPELVIKNSGKIILFVNHSAIQPSNNFTSVQINDSIWATYNISNSKYLNIKKKHLHAGINKFKFYLKSDNSDRSDFAGITITEIRFDLADIETLKEQLTEKKKLNIIANASNVNKRNENFDIKKSKGQIQKQTSLKKLEDSKTKYDKRTRKYLQHALTFLGYYHGTIDGVFGNKTRMAIIAYQKKQGEKPTGYLDKKTVNKLVHIGKNASKNRGSKTTTKAKVKKDLLNKKKKNVDYHRQEEMDSLYLSIRKKIEENQKEKTREIEKKGKLIGKLKNQNSKKAEVEKRRNFGILRTPGELAERYQSLIDRFNKSMSEKFYSQMLSSIQSCDRTGYYVSGAFLSHYLYMRFNDLASQAQTKLDAHRNSKLAEGFKITRNQLIMHYNSSTENKQALTEVLNKCEIYYQTTKERFLHSKN